MTCHLTDSPKVAQGLGMRLLGRSHSVYYYFLLFLSPALMRPAGVASSLPFLFGLLLSSVSTPCATSRSRIFLPHFDWCSHAIFIIWLILSVLLSGELFHNSHYTYQLHIAHTSYTRDKRLSESKHKDCLYSNLF